MFNISGFFKRIQNAHTKELFIRTVIRDSIKKSTTIEIPLESISFNASTAILKGISQSLRSVIFIKKRVILADINANQTIRAISDIR